VTADLAFGMAIPGRSGVHYCQLPCLSHCAVRGYGAQGKDRVIRKVKAMETKRKWAGIILMLAVLLLAYAGEGHTWRGGVFIRPSIVVPFGPFWGPHPYAYPPVVMAPPPVVVQPSPPPPQYWYYCDNPRGYYPYVQQCPGGWRPVAPTPP